MSNVKSEQFTLSSETLIAAFHWCIFDILGFTVLKTSFSNDDTLHCIIWLTMGPKLKFGWLWCS